jgi:hypothetical protein
VEKRALEGLVAACAAPQRKGRQRTPEKEMDRLRGQIKRLEREASANLALARAARLTGGLAVPTPATKGREAAKTKEGGKKRRKRRPATRALLVAAALRGAEPAAEAPPARESPQGAAAGSPTPMPEMAAVPP